MKNLDNDFEFSERPSTPEWFVTFADMMSLLVALFVMIISFSEVKEIERFHVMRDTLRGQFGQLAAGENLPGHTQPRQLRLAAAINAVRLRRWQLMQGERSPAIAGSADTSGTFVANGPDDRWDGQRK